MDDIILNIDPSVWNVLKFVILTIITTPLLELVFQHLIDTKATYDVLRGKKLLLSDSQLGLFSLHATHWGATKKKYLLLFIGLPVYAAELLFEFSFSVDIIDVAVQQRVWLPPTHDIHYTTSENLKFGRSDLEPTQFPLEATESCIQGPSEMLRIGSVDQNIGGYLSGFEYRMEGEYTIRKPYLAMDNSSILCSASKTVGNVKFVVPQVFLVNSSTKAEGVYAQVNTSGSESLGTVFKKSPFDYAGRLDTGFASGAVRENEQVVCMRTGRDFYCAWYMENTFVLANSSIFWSKTPGENFTLSVVLTATGSLIDGLRSRGRRMRLVATLIGSELLTTRLGGQSLSQRLITKEKLERVAFLTLLAANEEGVGGIREQVGPRFLLSEEKQSASMKRIAFVPIAFFLGVMVLLLVSDGILSLLIWSAVFRKGAKESGSRRTLRVETSIQWLRERVCADLVHDGIFEDITSKDISLKAIPDGFQMLPFGSVVPKVSLRIPRGWPEF
ncbi:hypothetical protein FGB62_133g07 [Gracilaria domingensis]|nr:hypothetical protein FGB62_133g07 [Gracilaria domingensis]